MKHVQSIAVAVLVLLTISNAGAQSRGDLRGLSTAAARTNP